MKPWFTRTTFLLSMFFVLNLPSQAQGAAGDWQGTLVAGQMKLRLLLKVSHPPHSKWTAELYSIDQTSAPTPVQDFVVDGLKVKFALPTVHGSYVGTLSADARSIDRLWSQGESLPLKFQRATKKSAWGIDSSKHSVQFVTVQPGIRLEVLDWGGSGPPIVLLAGLGNDAHIYDTFAEKLTRKFRVYGITRRGYGASDKPPVEGEAYSADRLGDDVLTVIGKLGLQNPVLIGHSIAGEELSSIGSRFPKRVAGLIYLDGGYTYALYDPLVGDSLLDGISLRNQIAKLFALQEPNMIRNTVSHLLETDLPRFQRDLLRQQEAMQDLPETKDSPVPVGEEESQSTGRAIMMGQKKYTRIDSPALVIFALTPVSPAANSAESKASVRDRRFIEEQGKIWERMVPSAKVILIPSASHYVFQSNETEVIKDLEEWIDGL